MKTMYKLCMIILGAYLAASCSARFDSLIAKGKYNEAEEVLKRISGERKGKCADLLIKEYLDLEEYDKAYNVCLNICCGTSKELLRKAFMETGDYDKVWELSPKERYIDADSPVNAEEYYKFMSDVILHLCSLNNKAEANKFLNHYSFWFYTRVDSSSYYSENYPNFRYDVVKSNLQRIINTY